MATFESKKYPHLTLQDDKGIWAQFKDSQFETTDAAVVKRLRGLPEEEGITEVKSSAKTAGDASSDDGGAAGSGDQK